MTPQLYFSDMPKTNPPRGSRQQLPGQELVGLGTPERSSPALLAIEEPGPGVPQLLGARLLPWGAALPWLIPGSIPAGIPLDAAWLCRMLSRLPGPCLPFPPPGSPGSRAPTHLTRPPLQTYGAFSLCLV